LPPEVLLSALEAEVAAVTGDLNRLVNAEQGAA
jgi:hypothetical protein